MANLTEAYDKVYEAVDRNILDWIEQYNLTKEQVDLMYESLDYLKSIGFDVTTLPGYDQLV